jgi:predicted dehydrogenase
MKNKIKWGILSTAQIAKTAVIPAIRTLDNCEVIAVASRSLGKAKAFASELDIPKAYGSYKELLEDPEIDAIYNPLPISLHLEWSVKCALANKPVLCEKPLTLDAKGAKEMISVFSEKKLLLAEALMYRYHPLTKKFISMLREGAIGEIKTVQSNFHVDIPNPDDIRFKKDTGGGALLDLGCYCVSIIRQITAEEPEAAKSFAKLNKEGVDETFTGIMQFPSDVLGQFECSLTSQFSCGYTAIGSEGKLVVDWGGMVPWPGEAFKIKYWNGEEYSEIEVPAANHYALMIEDFSNALLNGTSLQFDLQDTINNMQAIDLLQQASKI